MKHPNANVPPVCLENLSDKRLDAPRPLTLLSKLLTFFKFRFVTFVTLKNIRILPTIYTKTNYIEVYGKKSRNLKPRIATDFKFVRTQF